MICIYLYIYSLLHLNVCYIFNELALNLFPTLFQIKLEVPQTEEERRAYAMGQAPTLLTLGQAPTSTWMILVITGMRKNTMRKTEFRISSLLREDQWILLKRSESKVGYDFRPLRQVLSFPN